jgi:hypothetical protein
MSSHAFNVGRSRPTRRRLQENRVARRWLAAWVGGSALGIANGVVRELVYRERVGEFRANQIAVGSLIALLARYFWALERRWPLPSRALAVQIGAAWIALTVSFEFVFGHWVDHKSWTELTRNYDVARGRLWAVALVFIGVGPALVRRSHRNQGGIR